MNPRFIMIGGFLGAGKTTTISRLAKHFQDLGLRVAIVTNDQATDLVDTNLLRSQGFDVGEVAGSCFCCNFNELTSTVERLSADQRPDVVIAEPVGSCTDLVATVIRPLQQIYNQPFDIAPYGVIVKPSHGLKILKKVAKGGFSPQAEYIFRKQLEEADFIILNRIDELSADVVAELQALIHTNFPNVPVVQISATTGAGFDALSDQLDQKGVYGTRLMDVDYDVYAEGEAELGWLNAQVELNSLEALDLDQFVLTLVQRIQSHLASESLEVAHLKAIGMADGKFAVVNAISSDTSATLSMPSGHNCLRAELVINARVAVAPESLTKTIERILLATSLELKVEATIRTLQSFRPGRPVPTHRLLTN